MVTASKRTSGRISGGRASRLAGRLVGAILIVAAIGWTRPGTAETVWCDDSIPAGATPYGTWTWVTSGPSPFCGSQAHKSLLASGIHQHYFRDCPNRITPGTGSKMGVYVYIDPANPPTEIMLQWCSDASSWNHRAYWGANDIPWGTDGTQSRRYAGPLPQAGRWAKLEVDAALVGLENQAIHGMAFTLYDGRATFDKAGIDLIEPSPLHVPAQYSTIQAALDGSSQGDTIVVDAGIYTDPITIPAHYVVLESTAPTDWSVVEQTIIDADSWYSRGPIEFLGKGVLRGFRISGYDDYYAIVDSHGYKTRSPTCVFSR